MRITEYIKNNLLFLDGGMGTLLSEAGLSAGERPYEWCLSNPEKVVAAHKAYFDKGSNVVSTNTFGLFSLECNAEKLKETIKAAVECARRAERESVRKGEKWVALDLGPTGRMLKPYGEVEFERAVELYAEVVRIGAECGADLVLIETMTDLYEAKAAILGAKESCDLPVFVSCAYGEDGKMLTGASPEAVVATLEGLGADAVGINCSFGPDALLPVLSRYLASASVPVFFKPNAGLPEVRDGRAVYDMSFDAFAKSLSQAVSMGACAVGGCCGTTPEYIEATVNACSDIKPLPVLRKSLTRISSFTHTVDFGKRPVLIGERINPTGKKRLKTALEDGDIDYVVSLGLAEESAGADALDVNVGIAGKSEKELLETVIKELQAVCDLPLVIDTADPAAMERAMRIYNGKPLVNSVNGKSESLKFVLPLVKKYGGVLIALTLDEHGIPERAEDRLAIAKRILIEAERYGIDKKDIIFDPLAMTVAASDSAALETLRALRLIRDELGAHTSLGVSNVSYGLPDREIINSTFFALALSEGLSAAILNPHSERMMQSCRAAVALLGKDERCSEYIASRSEMADSDVKRAEVDKDEPKGVKLSEAITKGMARVAEGLTRELLAGESPMTIAENYIIPALNIVGERYEKGEIYLPGLLMSAEAAEAAFGQIKAAMPESAIVSGIRVALATVKGDVHDIGKNILKLLLENFGFRVYDLGKDVPPETIADAVKENNVSLLGLSALMTTTLGAMEETVALVKKASPYCRIMVGGAVVTEEYAQRIGAHFYGKDAMDGVRYAEQLDAERRAEIFG